MHNFRYFIFLSLFFVFPIFTFLFSLPLNDVVVFGKIFLAAFPCVFYTKDVLIRVCLIQRISFLLPYQLKCFLLSSKSGFRELFRVFLFCPKSFAFSFRKSNFLLFSLERLKLRRSRLDRKLTFVLKVAEFDSKWFVFSPKSLFCHILVVVNVSVRQNL